MQTCNNPDILKCIKRCLKPCHPGPCDPLVCAITCSSRTVVRPATISSPSVSGPARSVTTPNPRVTTPIPLSTRTATEPGISQTPSQSRATIEAKSSVYRKRWANIDKKDKNAAFYCLLWIVALSIPFLYLARVNAQRTTRPMENKDWTQYGQQYSYNTLYGLSVLHFCVVLPCTIFGSIAAFQVITKLCDFPDHGGRRFMLGLFAVIVGSGLVSAYPIV